MSNWKIDYGKKIVHFSSNISLDEMAKCLVNYVPEDDEYKILIYDGTGCNYIDEGHYKQTI